MESLVSLLKKSSEKIGLGDIHSAAALVPRWAEIVGEQVAEKTAPLRIKNKTLLVKTASPGWSHQLSLLQPTIIARLGEAGFEINDLRFIFQDKREKQTEKKRAPEVFDPDFSTVPPDVASQKLRQAIASYMGAKQGLKR